MAEQRDVNVGAVFGFAIGLAVVSVAVCVVVWLLFGYFAHRDAGGARQYPLSASQDSRLPPEPRLQVHPREDLRELRAQEDALLHSYQWVDKSAGVVRIPIEQAMRLTIERGLPTRKATNDH
jgi:hypothetical protein